MLAPRSMPWGPGAVAAYVTHPSTPGRTSPSSAEVSVEEALGCDLEQFRMGLGVELEHGPRDPEPDVSGDDPIVTGKIALAHLTEFPDYYSCLAALGREAEEHLRSPG